MGIEAVHLQKSGRFTKVTSTSESGAAASSYLVAIRD